MSNLHPRGLRRLEPQLVLAFLLKRGQSLRVIDPLGQQVSDLIAYSCDDSANGFLRDGRSTMPTRSTSRPATGSIQIAVAQCLQLSPTTWAVTTFLLTRAALRHSKLSMAARATIRVVSITSSRASPIRDNTRCDPDKRSHFHECLSRPEGVLTIAPPRSRPGDAIVLPCRA